MAMKRLSLASLPDLPPSVERPGYDPSAITTGIVHLGVGAFHRGQMAPYTDAVMSAGDRRWGIAGASLRATDTRDALKPQDFLYTLATLSSEGESLKVIGAIRNIIVAPEDPATLIQAMTSPDVKIVSITVTEKGYCHDPATNTLNQDHPDVVHDLKNPDKPRSVLGFIAAALERRRKEGLPPFTVLSCDNLPANGRTVKKILGEFAGLRDPALTGYIADQVACPSTMLDRIVPATTDADRSRISSLLGVEDAWPVVTEAYSQWVVEDDFPQGRPDWAATFVKDVVPYELMKLRLLNGAHSCMAYLGYLAGHETVADCMANPAMARFVDHLMKNEVIRTLPAIPGTDPRDYADLLVARFRNTSLRHRTWQIAMDGSQKLPQRFLGTIRERLARGLPIDGLALGIAAWMRYVTGRDEKGIEIDVRDPLRDELRRRADTAGLDAERLVSALLSVEAVFGRDLPQHPVFRKAVVSALRNLIDLGARETLNRFQGRPS
jgi:fructuronate reductase